jgi:uncharacterized protein YqjF (DUF2071 family)
MARALFMRWVDLAFLHWRVSPDVLRPHIPSQLEVDTFDGSAWIGVVPFRMTHVHPIALPPIPTVRDFPELNVRTYVRSGGRAGVWFFSLDAASRLAVFGARVSVGLPYFYASMLQRRTAAAVHYESVRVGYHSAPAELRARYAPAGAVFHAHGGSLEHWLTHRMCLFSTWMGKLMRVDVEHAPWPLQGCIADVERNTMTDALGITLPADPPHALFAGTLDVWAHLPVAA